MMKAYFRLQSRTRAPNMVTTIHSMARRQCSQRNAITERSPAAVSPSPPRNEMNTIVLSKAGEGEGVNMVTYRKIKAGGPFVGNTVPDPREQNNENTATAKL